MYKLKDPNFLKASIYRHLCDPSSKHLTQPEEQKASTFPSKNLFVASGQEKLFTLQIYKIAPLYIYT